MSKLDELERFYEEPAPNYGVLDDFSRILERYDATRSAADRESMRKELKRQLDAILKELVEIRHIVHDDLAVKHFADFKEQVRLTL